MMMSGVRDLEVRSSGEVLLFSSTLDGEKPESWSPTIILPLELIIQILSIGSGVFWALFADKSMGLSCSGTSPAVNKSLIL